MEISSDAPWWNVHCEDYFRIPQLTQIIFPLHHKFNSFTLHPTKSFVYHKQEQKMLNAVCIVGNLGADPEIRYAASGTCIANLRIAVNDKRKDQSGNLIEETYWFTATAFGKTAEVCANYTHKGSKIGIQGKLIQRTWQDQSGNNRSVVEIRVDSLELLGSKENNQGQQPPATNGQSRPQTQQHGSNPPPPPPPAGQPPYYQPQGNQPDPNYSRPNDDIPF
ncbi:MAG: single-stranded DNA-binding protein [Desulfobacteraceae bacterium]|nr:single-stranded DNA-binding protein [Desulfobacteraceae bacterium]